MFVISVSLGIISMSAHLNQGDGEVKNVDPKVISLGRTDDLPFLILEAAVVDKFAFATMV